MGVGSNAKETDLAVFVRFTTPSPRASSADCLRYITRESAVWKGLRGTLLVNIPSKVGTSREYPILRADLIAWAKVREDMERWQRVGRNSRTHYRAVLGFEREIGARKALQLAENWLALVLPRARAIVTLHGDTAHQHLHIWINARQTDGRKINLSARQFRQLDETWNRLYSQAMGLSEREHLAKKWQTERVKALRRDGQEIALPERKKREKRGRDETRETNAPDKDRTNRNQRPIAPGRDGTASREPADEEGVHRAPGTPPEDGKRATEFERTVSEIHRLREAASRLDTPAKRPLEKEGRER